MDPFFGKPLSVIVTEEIGLEGLDGITIEGLWRRLCDALEIPLPFTEHLCNTIWMMVIRNPQFQFYELPAERAPLKSYVRNCEKDGEATEYPFTTYKHNPISINGIRGSCEDFNTRKDIPDNLIHQKSLEECIETWGSRLVIVASQSLRESILIPESISLSIHLDLTIGQYCMLERVGRSRYQGEKSQGRHSLTDFLRDSLEIYSHRKMLTKTKLLVRQPYKEATESGLVNGSLLQLRRYYKLLNTHKPKYFQTFIHIVEYLKQQPKCTAIFSDIATYIKQYNGDFLRNMSRILSHINAHIVDINVPKNSLSQHLGVDDVSSVPAANDDDGADTMVRIFKLIDHNLKVDEVWRVYASSTFSDNNDADEENCFLDISNQHLDQSLLRQCYDMLRDSKDKGLTTKEMSTFLGLDKLTFRAVLKNIPNLKFYCRDEGRQRSKVFFLPEFSSTTDDNPDAMVVKDNSVDLAVSNTEVCIKPEPPPKNNKEVESPNQIQLVMPSAVGDIEVTLHYRIKFDRIANKDTSTTTRRSINRMKVIHAAVNNKVIIPKMRKLFKYIHTYETQNGYTDEMCYRSFMRLIATLVRQNRIRAIQLKLCYKQSRLEHLMVARQDTQLNNTALLACVERYKMQFVHKVAVEQSKDIQPKEVETNAVKNNQPNRNNKNIRDSAIKKTHIPAVPRFNRMRHLHEFLFYILHDLPSDAVPIPMEKLKECWKSRDIPMEIISNSEGASKIYGTQINWKMFIPPMTNNCRCPKGFAPIEDLFYYLPLSMFVRTFHIGFAASYCNEHLADPIKRHQTFTALPNKLQQQLLRYRHQLLDNLHLLCFIGLVDFAHVRDETFVRLNKHAILLNKPTIGMDAERCAELHYTFETHDDLDSYWTDMRRLCLSSKKKIYTASQLHSKPEMKELLSHKTFEEMRDDEGHLPGDRIGPSGIDSGFYGHLKRNWTNAKTESANESALHSEKRKRIKPTSTKYSTVLRHRKNNERYTIVHPTVLKPRPIALQKRKRTVYDEDDMQCLRQMNKLRVTWMKEEDEILFLCKIASLYFFGNMRHIMNIFGTMRDIIQWKCKSMNKTSRACQRRILYLLKRKPLKTQMMSCLEDVKQNGDIMKKYGPRFIKQLSFLYTDEQKLTAAARVHYVELVHQLMNNFVNLSEKLFDFKRRADSIPDTLSEFYEQFKEKQSDLNSEGPRLTDPTNSEDILYATLIAFMHSGMCCARDKTSWSVQQFDIYKNYPDQLLCKVTNFARQSHLIAANKKIKNRCENVPLTSVTFHLSFAYKMQLHGKISCNAFQQAYERLQSLQTDKMVNFTASNVGTCFVFIELLNKKKLAIDIKVPDSVVLLDPKKRHLAGDVNSKPSTSAAAAKEDEDPNDGVKQLKSLLSDDIEGGGDLEADKYASYKLSLEHNSTLGSALSAKIHKLHDFYVVNPCNITAELENKEEPFCEDVLESGDKKAALLEDLKNCATKPEKKLQYSDDDLINAGFCESELNRVNFILDFIYNKGELGATIEDLLVLENREFLQKAYECYRKFGLLMRVGVLTITYVHWDFVDPWLIRTYHILRLEKESMAPSTSSSSKKRKRSNKQKDEPPTKISRSSSVSVMDDDQDVQSDDSLQQIVICKINKNRKWFHIHPMPWIRVNGSLNRRVLDKWMGSILLYCVSYPGISLLELSEHFRHLFPVHLRILIETLEKIDCVKIMFMPSKKKVSLFSTYEAPVQVPACDFDPNDMIFVDVLPDAIIKMSMFVGDRKYAVDFI